MPNGALVFAETRILLTNRYIYIKGMISKYYDSRYHSDYYNKKIKSSKRPISQAIIKKSKKKVDVSRFHFSNKIKCHQSPFPYLALPTRSKNAQSPVRKLRNSYSSLTSQIYRPSILVNIIGSYHVPHLSP